MLQYVEKSHLKVRIILQNLFDFVEDKFTPSRDGDMKTQTI